jgi:thiamine transporter
MDVKRTFSFSVQDIAEIGILCGLAVILDMFVKIPVGITGGSAGTAMIPLAFIALHKGWFKGFIAGGVIFGTITCLIDGYGFVTYPMEYLLGFGSVAIIGALRRFIVVDEGDPLPIHYIMFAIAIVLCMVVRTIGGVVDSMVIYEVDFYGSLTYNLSYLLPTLILLLIFLVPFLKPFNSLFKRVK